MHESFGQRSIAAGSVFDITMRDVLKTVISSFILLLCVALACLVTAPAEVLNGDLLKVPALDTSEGPGPLKDGFVSIGTLRVHYVEGGTGQTVVLIHGNAGSVEDFEFGTIKALSRKYRVVAIDRPGHGTSDRPEKMATPVEDQADLLHETLTSLGVKRPILVGHSWGAAVALAYALKYPNDASAMVLLAPAAYADHADPASFFLRGVAKIFAVGELLPLLGHSIISKSLLRKELDRAFYPQTLPEKYFKLASATWLGKKQLKAYYDDETALNDGLTKIQDQYSSITIPTVIVTGDQDKVVSAKENAYRLHKVIRHSRLIQLRHTGHEIPETRPESIYYALRSLRPPAVRP